MEQMPTGMNPKMPDGVLARADPPTAAGIRPTISFR